MINNKENSLWSEKYRPSSLETFIGNVHLKEKLQRFLDDGDIPHLLLYGPAGTGKTTISKMLYNTIDCDYIYINASDKGGVEFIRNQIIPFASSVGFNDLKIVVLDECLDENTLVTVFRQGDEVKLPIKDVDERTDLVKSLNIETEKIEWKPFYLWDKGNQEVLEFEFENGEVVVCTPDHKWYIDDSNGNPVVVKAADLVEGQDILSL